MGDNNITNDFFHNIEAIPTSLTCNGRNTDSIVAALGWSGAGATIPPRPLSTPPGNESCGPGNKTKMSQNTMAKNNRNTRNTGCDSVVGYTYPASVSGVNCTAKKTVQTCQVFVVLGTRDSARSSR